MSVIIEHDGRKYLGVERKAKEGELISIVKNDMGHGFEGGEMRTYEKDGFIDGWYVDDHVGTIDYVVLEPIDETAEVIATEGKTLDLPTIDESNTSPQVVDIIANIARRVTELERVAADLSQFHERQHAINGNNTERLTMLSDNLRTFAEQTESNAHDIALLESKIEGDVAPLHRFSPLQRAILASDLPLGDALDLAKQAGELERKNRERVNQSELFNDIWEAEACRISK